jgi:hypothetical protein
VDELAITQEIPIAKLSSLREFKRRNKQTIELSL